MQSPLAGTRELGWGSPSLWKILRISSPRFCDRSLSGNHPDEQEERSLPRPFSEMPGLKGIPILGNVLKFTQMTRVEDRKRNSSFHQLHSEFGPIYRFRMLGNRWHVVTSSPEAAEVVFRMEGNYPSRGYFEESMMWIHKKLNSPPPMFLSGGEVWKKLRSNASKQVAPRRVGNFVEPLSDIAVKLLSHLESIGDESGVQDIRPELHKWAFQGVAYFVYGEKLDTFDKTDLKLKEFIEVSMDSSDSISDVVTALPLIKLFPSKRHRNYVRVVNRIHGLGKEILDRRYEMIKDEIASGTVDETKAVGLLDQWLIEGKFTREEALSQSCDMLSAGIDTTSSAACFLLYEIAKQPELQERLVQEISSTVGDKEHPSWDDLQKMKLVRNCVKESMRMYVPIGGITRTIDESMELMDYHIPGGTTVIFSGNTASKDDNLFEHPREFNPDRWSKDALTKSHPFASIPFGFGPRSCYGRRLAELELYVLLAKTLPKYRLTTNIKNMKLRVKVLLQPDLPLHMCFQLRQ